MIRFNDVSKDYAGHDVLCRVSCELSGSRKGGLVGRNGAGKTTLIRLLLGEEEPSSGSVERGGLRLGFVPQELPPEALALPVEGWLLASYRERRATLAAHEARLTELGVAGDDVGLARELSAYQR
jgi:ATP-binding cassette subfamily F protein 3